MKRWLKVSYKTVIQLLIGVTVLWVLVQIVGQDKLFYSLTKLDPLLVILAAAFFIVASLFVSLALYIPLKSSSSTVSSPKVILASFAGQLLSDLTPSRSGYFLTPFLLKGLAEVPLSQGLMSVLATGAINSIVKVLLCCIALIYFIRLAPLDPVIVNVLPISLIVLLAGGIFLLLVIMEKRMVNIIKKLEKIPLLSKWIGRFVGVLEKVQVECRKSKRALIMVGTLILLSVIANAAALKFVSLSLQLHNPPGFIDFLFMVSIGSALMYLPVTIAGLGVQEAGYVIILQTVFKIPMSEALAFALIARALFTGTDIIGIFPLLKIGLKVDYDSSSIQQQL